MIEDTVVIDDALVIRETAQAVLVRAEGEDFWCPKSQIADESEVFSLKNPGPGKLVIPRWLAQEKGFEIEP